MSWYDDFQWADEYLPAVRAIVGPRLLTPAPLARDMREATDLIVLHARDMRIAVRVRRPEFAGKYLYQVTFRSGRPNGTKTELSKIVDGWGDWFFYGHAGPNKSIVEWYLVDLSLMRAAWVRCPGILHHPDNIRSGEGINRRDGTEFRWVRVDMLGYNVLVASNVPEPTADTLLDPVPWGDESLLRRA